MRPVWPINRMNARALLMLAAAATLVSCASVPRSIETPRVRLASLSFIGADGNTQTFALTLLVENLNPVPVPIEQIRLRVRLGGEGYLSGESGTAVTIPALDTETVRVEIETDLVSSQSRLMALVQGPQNALPYELDGELNVGGRPPRLLPFQYRGMVPFSMRAGD